MRSLIWIHRWLGVGFCLFFAMWFATGIVMHFVPFPSLTEAERIAGLSPIDPNALRHAVGPSDDYAIHSTTPGAPVYRVMCGDTWFHVDGANGAMLEKLDPSRRAYRWLYGALHTLDFPVIAARPAWRTLAVVLLCSLGLAFSTTAIVIGWRRLRRKVPER